MSCLFNSLSHFIPENSTQLRNKICDYLLTNPVLIDDLSTKDVILFDSGKSLEQYVSHMRKTSTWGGAIEIRAFCNIYGKNVVVRNIRRRENTKIHFINEVIKDKLNVNGNDEATYHITWSGGHYEPVRKQ